MKQVLLYSKYSESCRQLLQTMERYGANIAMVCLDNKEVRQRVMNDKRLTITVVPTLLSLYDTGVVEKYEGSKVMELLLSSFEKINQQKQVTIPKPPQEPVEQKTIIEESPGDTNWAERMTTKVAKQEPPAILKPPDETSEKRTNILDLDAETNTDESPPVTLPPPDNDSLESSDENNERGHGENLPIKQSSGVNALAAQMAKERESQQAAMPRGAENNIRPSN